MSVRPDPFEQMEAMFEQLRRGAFAPWDGTGRPALAGGDAGEIAVDDGSTLDASVSVEERDGEYVVLADIPGFERDELGLTLQDGRLTITGTHEESDDAHYRSRRVSETVAVPRDVRVEDAEASYHNGVLEVVLPADGDDGHVIDIE